MSGIASAALTTPGSVAPLAICSREASLWIAVISASSATTSAGTRIPGRASGGMRQRNGPTRSMFIRDCHDRSKPGASRRACGRRALDLRARRAHAAGQPALGAVARPGQANHRHQHTHQARQLRDAEGTQPEAVEPEGLDQEAADRVETDVAEEQRARAARAGAAVARSRGAANTREVPQRFVEERRDGSTRPARSRAAGAAARCRASRAGSSAGRTPPR